MEVSIEIAEGATIVSPQGRLDFAATTEFQQKLQGAITGGDNPPGAVIVDCSGLSYLSSAGLRAFLIVARTAQSGGVPFLACSLQKGVREVFDISGFSQIIVAHPDRAAALASLAGAR